MHRVSLTLLTIALTGWVVAGVAHVRALRADDETEREEWTTRRNQYLLLSSISMNSFVAITLYRYVKKFVSRKN
jgi:hypothetical protein